MKIAELIAGSLTTRVAPMVYIMMWISVLIGFFFATGLFMGDSESVLYQSGVLLPSQTWGALLLVTALSAEAGFVTRRRALVLFGGFSGFSLWLLASIELFLDKHWYVLFTVGLFHLSFHGYVYLATSMGVLERTVDKDD